MELMKEVIGNYKDNEVIEYTMRNNNGIEVSVLNFGGIIRKIITPDNKGNLENIVLAYRDIEDYFTNSSYYGALIGRTSGRIGGSKAILNDEEYEFYPNYNPNSGHGGKEGFDKKFWTVEEISSNNECGVELNYYSPDGEEGYPGNVSVKVTYTLNNNNELKFLIKGNSDKDTLFNITNHSYFNLSGDYKRDITKSELMINSDEYLEINNTGSVTGEVINSKNTPFDFTVKKEIGKDINIKDKQLELGNGYDHPFLFNSEKGNIVLEDRESGRGLEVETNQQAVVIYTANYPGDEELENGEKPKFRGGICLETQSPPISESGTFIEHSILRKNEEYSKETKYKFYLIK